MHQSEFNLSSTTPLARMTSEFQAIGVPYDSPIQSLEELVALFKDKPQNIIWGGGSAGGADHLFVNLLAEQLSVKSSDINYVAFTGGGEATAALMGGQVTAGVSGYSEWGGLVEAKRVRLLGISSKERVVNPNIATFSEIGVDVVFENWRGIVAPPGISDEETSYLIDLLTLAYQSPTWKDILERNQWQDSFLTGDAFNQFIETDRLRTERIVKNSGLGSGGEGYAAVGPYFFPMLAGIGLLISGGFILFSYLRTSPLSHSVIAQPNIKPLLWLATCLFLYILGLKYLGFLVVTPIIIPLLSRLYGSTSLYRDVIVGSLLTIAVYFIFENFLNVIVP